KHAQGRSRLAVWWDNARVLSRIRKGQYDVAIGCGYSPRIARYAALTGAKRRVGYPPGDGRAIWGYNVPVGGRERRVHEVEAVYHLLTAIGIHGTPPRMRVVPLEGEAQKVRDCLNGLSGDGGKPLVAFHISSRHPENRWPAEKFIELARSVHSRKKAAVMLLWSPGSEKNVYHPGDDEKAEFIMQSVHPSPLAYKTLTLRELIAALAVSDLVVCGDGGAMHIAAALEKRIVTIWGSTNPIQWRPWGVPYVLLQDKSKKAEDISVQSVIEAVESLLV
ncbi:MAG TPA: glycosyltransferase family 9 protein, partial [Thermodesulfovibrionales bacterium]|nr:glycosyltransferase family 9 protein [Thermodesulfovibrionales bacterium]